MPITVLSIDQGDTAKHVDHLWQWTAKKHVDFALPLEILRVTILHIINEIVDIGVGTDIVEVRINLCPNIAEKAVAYVGWRE